MGRAEFPQTAPLILPDDQNLKWVKDFVFNAGIRGEKGGVPARHSDAHVSRSRGTLEIRV